MNRAGTGGRGSHIPDLNMDKRVAVADGCRCKLIDSSDIMSCVFHEMRNAIKCTNTLCRLKSKYSAYIRFTAVKSIFYRYPYFLSGQDWE